MTSPDLGSRLETWVLNRSTSLMTPGDSVVKGKMFTYTNLVVEGPFSSSDSLVD